MAVSLCSYSSTQQRGGGALVLHLARALRVCHLAYFRMVQVRLGGTLGAGSDHPHASHTIIGSGAPHIPDGVCL
jgi:hypothetical protein